MCRALGVCDHISWGHISILEIRFMSADWLHRSSSLIFFSKTSSEFCCLCAWDRCLAEMSNIVSSSSSWQQIFIKNVLVHFFNHSSFKLYENCHCHILKSPTPWCPHLQTSLLSLGWYAAAFGLQTWCVLWHSKSSVLVSSDQNILGLFDNRIFFPSSVWNLAEATRSWSVYCVMMFFLLQQCSVELTGAV